MNNEIVNSPYFIFIFVATIIAILTSFFKLLFKRLLLLWKSTLISYVVFLVFATLMAIGSSQLNDAIAFSGYILIVFTFILLTPGLLIYGLIPGVIKPCPSDNDVFGWLICAFIFYIFVIWGIMKIVKKSKENKAAEIKQDDNVEKQPVSDNDSKGI